MPILTDPARFKVVVCGRRWGKTATALLMALRGHGPAPGHWRGALHGGRLMWVAPTYKIIKRRVWPDLKRVLAPVWLDKDESDKTIWLPGGGMIQAVSAENPDSLVGDGADGVVIDEASKVVADAWRESLRPTLSDRGGWACFISTPNGRNWFHSLFEDADWQPGWARWQRPTRDNPLIPQAELDAALLEIGPRAFAQEYEAQFMDVEGAEWPGEYFDGIWYDELPHQDDLLFSVLALDPSLGKTDRSDYSALVWLTVDRRGVLYVDADLERRDASRIAADAVRICRQVQPLGFAVEANQFQTLLASDIRRIAREQGYDPPIYEVTNTLNKLVRIRSITPYLSRRELRFKRSSRGARLLVEQLVSFPVADYDDGPDALELAIRLAKWLATGGDAAGGHASIAARAVA